MSPDPETLQIQPIMSLDCVHRWMSKCWSVQLQWHILADPSHQSSEPKKGTTQTPREVLRPVNNSDHTSLWWPLDLYFVVRGQRAERWSCVSLSQTELFISCLVGLCLSGPLQFITKGSCSQHTVLLQVWCLTLQCDCWQSPFTAALGSTPVHKCSRRIYIFGTIKKSFFFFLHKHRNQCCPFTYNMSGILAVWIGGGLVFKNKWNLKSIDI